MKQKIYEPIREFERHRSYCQPYLAWYILDSQIDAPVYDFYALTPAEIKIVESVK